MAELNVVDTGAGGVQGQIVTPYMQTLVPGYSFGTGNGYMEFGSGTPGALPFRVDQAGNVTAASVNASLLGGLQPSGDTTGAKDTAAIQALVNLGSLTIQLGAGNFYVTAASGFALTWASHVNMYGVGVSITTLNVVGTNIGGITGTDLSHVNFRDFQLVGTSGTSGDGTSNQGIWVQKNTGPSAYMEFTNVLVKNFNGIGLEADDLIVSTFREFWAVTNALHGIYINVGTSLTFDSCYANTNSKGIGYWLKNVSYSVLNACANDGPAEGYLFQGCTGVAAVACGVETPLAAGSYNGDGFVVNGGNNVSIIAPRNLTNNAVAYWVTGNATNVILDCPLEQSPGGSATASIKVDSGSSCAIRTPNVTTAMSIAGTVQGIPAAPFASTPNGPTGTASTTLVMMGLGSTWAYTPASSGKVLVTVTGTVTTATGIATATFGGRYGTGVAPANGVAVTGTRFGSTNDASTRPEAAASGMPFAQTAVLSLTPGTAYWFDLALDTNTGADVASVAALSVSIVELS